MTDYSLLNIATFVVIVAIFSQLAQDKLKLPASISALSVGLLLKVLSVGGVIQTDYLFDQMTLILLPILLTLDILHLRWEYVKKHGLSLFAAAGVSVLLAIAAGVGVSEWMLPGYELPIAAVVMLMCMVTATDPCSVSAIFATQDVPKDLKILAEGESCGNDATVLVVFSLALFVETNPTEATFTAMSIKGLLVVFGALGIGAIVGIVGVWLMKMTRNMIIETLILLGSAYLSFAITEHFHFSGILAIITSAMLVNTVILKRIEEDNRIIRKGGEATRAIVDKANHESMQTFIQFLGVIAVTVMFLSLGDIVDFSAIAYYWKEILSVFLASTLIRAFVMFLFGLVSNQVRKMQNIPFSWYKVMVFGGVKGCLSLIMLHLISDSKEYKETFEAIVIGVILLTTFVYPLFLVGTLKWYGERVHHTK
tara:strand:- start:4540 stop:5811 length:1272 start_codon:yes stop_codon:yes gene_type:complete